MKVNVDKTLVASIALHVLVLGWGIVTFGTRLVEVPPEESLPVDIISADQLSKITHGIKSGEKDKPKPKVEKVAEAQPVDDAVGKITEKKEIITESAPPKPQEPVEKPVEKPDPPKPKPKPVAESKPKEPPKPQDKKPDPAKEDPMAELIKKQETKKPETKKPEIKKPETKPTPKQETKAAPAQTPPKPKQEHVYEYNESRISALLTKQAPQRQALTGAVENASASFGTAHGKDTTLSASEMGQLIARLSELWIVPNAGSPDRRKEMTVVIRFQLTRDRRLAGPPVVVSRGNSQLAQVCAEAAVRAVLQGAPYNMLRDATYDKWSDMQVTFDPDLMFRS